MQAELYATARPVSLAADNRRRSATWPPPWQRSSLDPGGPKFRSSPSASITSPPPGPSAGSVPVLACQLLDRPTAPPAAHIFGMTPADDQLAQAHTARRLPAADASGRPELRRSVPGSEDLVPARTSAPGCRNRPSSFCPAPAVAGPRPLAAIPVLLRPRPDGRPRVTRAGGAREPHCRAAQRLLRRPHTRVPVRA